ncbi:MAG: ATP-binding protein [Sandaracinaceae bacterium]|nr:ATP-binding protein [Sandaracinaceae bacterium]
MLAWSSAISLALLWLGVTGLVDAYVATARVLDRMRVDAIDQAAERARHAEAWGAKVAHEIRNPLTSIKGLVQLVARKNEDARDARRFEVVLGEVERVEGILDDYLRLARPLRDLSLESARLERIVSDLAVLFEARASASGVTIALALEPAPAMVDPTRVREALVNLAKNALEAMPAGGTLTLRACLAGERAQVEVIDTGPGIDPELLARLGDAFVSTREEGTGLGLALARGVARASTEAISSSRASRGVVRGPCSGSRWRGVTDGAGALGRRRAERALQHGAVSRRFVIVEVTMADLRGG